MTDFYEMPGFLIRRLHQISVSVFADRLAREGYDITPVQFAALSSIAQHPALDQATLAGLIAYDRVTIGGVIDRLERKGFVARRVKAEDRRAREVLITPEGEAALVAIGPVVAALQSDILSGLSEDERAQLLRLLQVTIATGNSRSRAPMVGDTREP